MPLPQEFISYTSHLFGLDRWQHFLNAFQKTPITSVRLNPWKQVSKPLFSHMQAIPWCQQGYFLKERPNFTRDPLFHAGVYYVQEAGSLFLDHILRHHISSPVLALDLCAAPGGKSTLMRASLPKGSLLVSNEPDRRRANILLENMIKQGHPDVLVTHNFPHDFSKTNWQFDVILTDVPCSGEGLFRRDEKAIWEWSSAHVHACQKRQRQILQNIWPCLRNGGLLIYSTCTFNTYENEENVRFIQDELGADILSVPIEPAWQITGSLWPDLKGPVYRFIPGITPSEGFFIAVLRKKGTPPAHTLLPESLRKQAQGNSLIHLLSDGIPTPAQKGKEQIPSIAQALSIQTSPKPYPRVELTLEQAQRYLHREALVLPSSTPNGYVIATYENQPLGFLKNVGDRANNLYPKNWAIRCL